MNDQQSKRRTGLDAFAYLGVDPTSPFDFVIEERAPAADDSQNFNIGTRWLNITGYPSYKPQVKDLYILISIVGNVATWVPMGGGDVDTLTGNTGGAIPPDASGNINLLGNTSIGLTVSGNPSSSTLTLTTVNGKGLLESLTGDSGGPVFGDSSNNINLLGSTNVDVLGNPGMHLVGIDVAGTIADTFTDNTGTSVPVGHNLNIFGTNVITTSASGSTVSINLTNGTNGQTLIGGGTHAEWENITGNDGSVIVTNGANSIDLRALIAPNVQGFSAYSSVGFTNCTGDGTAFTIPFNKVIYNIGGMYNTSTGIATIPITGLWFLYGATSMSAQTAGGGKVGALYMTTSSLGNFQGSTFPTNQQYSNFRGPNNVISYAVKAFALLSMGDLIRVQLQASGGSKTCSIPTPPGTSTPTLFYAIYAGPS